MIKRRLKRVYNQRGNVIVYIQLINVILVSSQEIGERNSQGMAAVANDTDNGGFVATFI